jgi:hypothetical protein
MQADEQSKTCRVAVFIDWQNCYRTARDAFGFRGPGIDGKVKPLMLARALAMARVPGQGKGELQSLRIDTGRASQHHDTKTYAANRRQFQAWVNADPNVVEVIACRRRGRQQQRARGQGCGRSENSRARAGQGKENLLYVLER